MKATTASVLAAVFLTADAAPTLDVDARDVDTRFPYTGPAVPVGDWVNNGVKSNGRGFPRLVEPPAVEPSTTKPKNNINVISLAYVPEGMNIHYSTPFGLGQAPKVQWGYFSHALTHTATGQTKTYDRTPPCSDIAVTQCNQYFHDVQLKNLRADTTYYYKILAANGTTASSVMSFKTARAAGDHTPFTIAVLNDMGYTNAHGTHKYLTQAAEEGLAFAWHGGDISYADDWYSGILACEDDWPVCYNGTSTELPGGAPVPKEYLVPLPEGEVPNQGGPQGGDMSVLYESNWDLWQGWMNSVSTKVPYMVMPGNHEAACAEFDGTGNPLTAYLNNNETNSTAPETELTYYSCPPSQRNYTTYQHRFRMPGEETGGRSNFWYSFDYGLAHFIALNGETDFADSPESPFLADIEGNEALPTENQTYITDSGPFGRIDKNDFKNNQAYEQVQWLKKDLASVDREKTPWIIAMSHRPMYSSEVSSYQTHVRNAFEPLLLEYGVDAYFAGHIHWYERLFPLGANGTIDTESIVNNNTYKANPGKSMTHIINGMAGNIESHSYLADGKEPLNITAVLNHKNYGFSKLTFNSAEKMTWQYIKGDDGSVGDELTITKESTTKGHGPPHWGPPSWEPPHHKPPHQGPPTYGPPHHGPPGQ